jgi:hypothetical protein
MEPDPGNAGVGNGEASTGSFCGTCLFVSLLPKEKKEETK